jgi:hypothetical protein
MALQHSNTADAWTPADYGQLVNLAVQSKSVAFKAATVFQTDKVRVNFPLRGIPKARTVTVLRKGTEVVTSKDAGFYNDAVDIRAIARVGFGFLQPASVIRLYDAP